jgi:hypothetical protein
MLLLLLLRLLPLLLLLLLLLLSSATGALNCRRVAPSGKHRSCKNWMRFLVNSASNC